MIEYIMTSQHNLSALRTHTSIAWFCQGGTSSQSPHRIWSSHSRISAKVDHQFCQIRRNRTIHNNHMSSEGTQPQSQIWYSSMGWCFWLGRITWHPAPYSDWQGVTFSSSEIVAWVGWRWRRGRVGGLDQLSWRRRTPISISEKCIWGLLWSTRMIWSDSLRTHKVGLEWQSHSLSPKKVGSHCRTHL